MTDLVDTPLEKLLEHTGGRFILASVAAGRSKEVNEGAKILSSRVDGKSHTIAIREIAQGLVPFQLAEAKDASK